MALLVLAAMPVMAQHWNLVPNPARVQALDGSFEPRGGLRVVVSQPANRELHGLGELAAEILRESFGLRPALVPEGAGATLGPAVRLSLVAQGRGISAESYVLEVTRDGIMLSSPSTAGLFYGLQTLRQMVDGAGPDPTISAVRIEDSPRFQYRGVCLDTGAQPARVQDIERWIDLASGLKFNALHWRSAALSQEDLRRLIGYGRARYVEIFPEPPIADSGALGGAMIRSNAEDAAAALRQGSEVIVEAAAPQAGASLAEIYAFEPVAPGLSPAEAGRIRGGETRVSGSAPQRSIELEAMAEAFWSPRERRDFADFEARVQSIVDGAASAARAPTPP